MVKLGQKELEERQEVIKDYWIKYVEKNGEPPRGSVAYLKRRVDRIHYRSLQRRINNLNRINRSKVDDTKADYEDDLVEYARELFNGDK